MKIAFYADHPYWSQLANNGGTRTILLSAQTLNTIGHTAIVIAHKDRFTWFKHPKPIHKIPTRMDVVIAVTISDAAELLGGYVSGRIRCGRIAYWARPYEPWQMGEEDIFRLLKKFIKVGGVVMVNSLWQQKELAHKGISAELIYQGYDLPSGGIKSDGPWEGPYYIGCQYSSKQRKGWGRVLQLHEALDKDEYKFGAFGNDRCKDKRITIRVRQPSAERLAEFYRGCHFFFCSSKLEGLYNPGIEAALCGCLLVVLDDRKNGCMDYCNHETAIIGKTIAEIAEAMGSPQWGKVAKCQEFIEQTIGTRERNMKRMAEVLSA
jgi:hypothetical protein